MMYKLIAAAVLNTDSLPRPTVNNGKLLDIVNLVIGLTASIAVLMIVIAGFRYILAHGDSNATAQARNAMLYAIIGLIVTMVAYSIVTFVVKGIS